MSAGDPSLLSIVEASAAISHGSFSPVELVRATLERIEAHDDRIRSFVTVAAENRARLHCPYGA